MRTSLILLLTLPTLGLAAEKINFRTQVYPLLHDRCFRCHQGDDAPAGVRLDLKSEVLKRMKRGKSADSLLVRLVSGTDAKRVMPPKGERLNASQIQILRDWIDQGAAWDDDLLPATGARSNHWAFQSVTRPAIPQVKNANWVRTPVDAFIAAKQEANGISPAGETDRRTLLRRLSFVLTGLPPARDEIEAFERDPRPDAYERQVERLLGSPAYGERWARHWLDVARYADSEGYESDHLRPYAWRYRDWVIHAFNDDLPYEQFVKLQLAGDEVVPYRNENLIATGFLAAARLSSNEEDKSRQLNDMYVDVANATAATFLGLTMNCAQCHSHKFDPLSHGDYYRFQGFFLQGMPYNLPLRDAAGWEKYESAKPPEYEPARTLLRALFNQGKMALTAKARKSLTPEQAAAYDTPSDQRSPELHRLAVEASLKFQWTDPQVERAIPASDQALYAELKKKVTTIEEKLPDPPQTWGFYSPATSPHTISVLPMKGFYPPPFDVNELKRAKPFLLAAGDSKERRELLESGWPAVFGETPKGTRTRTALAEWLTGPRNPLTARVWVNRIWQYHFGRGIVATPNDFGTHGSPPSHRELLDWLAAELVSSGWSTKHIHRLIVNSATFRQSSKGHGDSGLYSRWTPRRLEAEAIRDAMMAVSGGMDSTMGGKPEPDEDKNLRRGIYQIQIRQKLYASTLFDAPTGATESCPKRTMSTTPLHALFLMNNEFPVNRAKSFAARVRTLAGDDRTKQATAAFRLALGRSPTPAELKLIEDYLRKTNGDSDPLAVLCHTLFSMVEFTTVD